MSATSSRPTVLRAPEELARVSPMRAEPLLESGDPFEAARAEAAYAGYEEGRRRARLEAERERALEREAAANALQHALDALSSAVDAARRAYADALGELEPRLVAFAARLVEEILGYELAIAENPGHHAVSRALQLLPVDGAVVVRLNPEEVRTLLAHVPTERELRVQPDPTIRRGGCVLEIGATLIDARIESAIERVRNVLEQAVLAPPTARGEDEDSEEHIPAAHMTALADQGMPAGMARTSEATASDPEPLT